MEQSLAIIQLLRKVSMFVQVLASPETFILDVVVGLVSGAALLTEFISEMEVI